METLKEETRNCALEGHDFEQVLISADGQKYGLLKHEACLACGAANPDHPANAQDETRTEAESNPNQ